ncbi:RHS repeat-associated core domain [Pseudomonas asplenii]|uniref:RHS repeat-associated core domain n=1 Tax=Pseudomonas asplenii TaxID=53407 RepID=A0A0M9GH03_9PSED|nr:RHS repeat-associated core domain-containing protein [Pseudomonas fuscovaginae]KPA90704.1 RHS repeat-associated core domain [Pseudomonas fuscovaginae]
MSSSTSLHSSALNFMQAIQNGVDPRTGQYRISLDLSELQANQLRGPAFPLSLAFSALNREDRGYGTGWTLQLSEYAPTSRVLSLYTGELHIVTGNGANDELLMQAKKLDSFRFYNYPASELGKRRYKVVHKDGLVEVLEEHGRNEIIAVPVEIHSPLGHKLTLSYALFNSQHPRLESIKDENGTPILEIRRDTGSLTLDLHPGSGPSGGPLARYVLGFDIGTENHVRSITLPADSTGQTGTWRFDYDYRHEHLVIVAVQNPLGGSESITYGEDHAFPNSATRKLPRVTRHEQYPDGDPQNPDKLEVHYSYSADGKNFLGNTLPISWSGTYHDPLIYQMADYIYETTQTHYRGGIPVRSTLRQFNRFHSLTLERIEQGNTIQETQTDYNLVGGSVVAQPTTYQLPMKVVTRWRLKNDATRHREETESFAYDTSGNELKHTQANGQIRTSSYFLADGTEADCPRDPYGFVRKLRSRTMSPAVSSDYDAAPTLKTYCRYIEQQPLSDSRQPPVTVLESETLVQVHNPGTAQEREETLQQTRFEYHDAPADRFLHGQPRQQAITLNGMTTRTRFHYEVVSGGGVPEPTRQTMEILTTDFDAASSTTIQQHALLTGWLLLEQSNETRIRYEYDNLGRLTRETTAPGTAFEASRQYSYSLSGGLGKFGSQTIVSTREITTRTVFDGLGRAFYEERDQVHENNQGRVEPTYGARFDGLGDLIEETLWDYFEEDKQDYVTRYQYDDWGRQSCVIDSAGVEQHTDFNPIGDPLKWTRGPIQTTWQQSPGARPLISGKSETWLNLFEKPVEVHSQDAQGARLSSRSFRYDGLGNCTRQTDEKKRVTRFSYDPWLRMLSTTLPDNTTVRRAYAEHSQADLPTWLSVLRGSEETEIGTQHFDGLERLTWTQTGPYRESFFYQGEQLQPHERITAAGESITYKYNLQLTDEPERREAPEELSTYVHDPLSALLTAAENSQGKRTYRYYPDNRLRHESWTDSQGKTWETEHVSSLNGSPIRRIDRNGSSEFVSEYHYYGDGRLKLIAQGNLQASFHYDRLGRLESSTTTDTAAGSHLVTTLGYDEQNREILRTQQLDGHPTRRLEQRWDIDGQLGSRHLQLDDGQGNLTSLLKETFFYDQRGRLEVHRCSGLTLPKGEDGRAISEQVYVFDPLDNITLRLTRFADGTDEMCEYHYRSDDPFQLTGISRSLDGQAVQRQDFEYDANGNLLNDLQGQRLYYDSQNRLLEVRAANQQPVSQYRYDGHDQLLASQEANQEEILRFYQGGQLSHLVQGDRQTHFLENLGQQQPGDPDQTLLLLSDGNGSVLGEGQSGQLRTAVYNAYGERSSDETLLSLKAFNGELREAASGWYLLGSGYRAYNPQLMRFHSRDNLSPFGSGGLNPYCYCLGNPILMTDPTGHASSTGRTRVPNEDEPPVRRPDPPKKNWIGVIIGAAMVAVSFAVAIGTLGSATPAAVIISAVGVGMAAGATVFEAVGVETRNETFSKAAFGMGIASAVLSVAHIAVAGLASTVMRGSASGYRSTSGFSWLLGHQGSFSPKMPTIVPEPGITIPRVQPISAGLAQSASAAPTPLPSPRPIHKVPASGPAASSAPNNASGGSNFAPPTNNGAGSGGRAANPPPPKAEVQQQSPFDEFLLEMKTTLKNTTQMGEHNVQNIETALKNKNYELRAFLK